MQLLRQGSPPATTGCFHGHSADPQRSDHDSYSALVIPPPPPPPATQISDAAADVDAFLAKIIACNGVLGPAAVVNGLNVGLPWAATSRYFGRQMSEPTAQSDSRPLGETRSPRTAALDSTAATMLPYGVDRGGGHYRCASMTNGVEGVFTRNPTAAGYLAQSSMAPPPALQPFHNDERFNTTYQRTGEMNGAQSALRNNISGHSPQFASAANVPSTLVGNYGGRVPRIHAGVQQNLDQADRTRCDGGIPPLSASTPRRSPAMPERAVGVGAGGSLTRGMAGRRRPPPPPPPRTTSVQSSPALSCRSEQLTRRGLPPPPPPPPLPRSHATEDRVTPLPITPLPTPPSTSGSLSRSTPIRPVVLRSSLTNSNESTAECSPPSSPDWNFRRSHSLTESAAATTRSSPRRPSLLSAIGSRLKSYWSPRPHRQRPATATGDYRRPSLEIPSQTSMRGPGGKVLLLPDDEDEETYVSFDVLKSRQSIPTSPTMSSFTSFSGE